MASAQPRPDEEPTPRRGPGDPVVGERPLVDRPEIATTPTTFGSAAREAEHRRRLTARMTLGAALGVVAGAAAGAVLGAIAFSSVGAIVASGLAAALAVGALGAFWGGMASLGDPDPGEEPSGADDPLGDRGVSRERDVSRVRRRHDLGPPGAFR